MSYQTIMETFFSMLGRFDFDRAKSYIDGQREVLQELANYFPNHVQQMTMLATFSHLAEVEKNYHNQPFISQTNSSFLATTSFLRKAKTLKEMYNDIYLELQQLEQIESTSITNDNRIDGPVIIQSTKKAIIHGQTLVGRNVSPPAPKLTTRQSTESNTSSSGQQNSSPTSSSIDKDSPICNIPSSTSSTFRSGFFRVLSPISLSTSIDRQVTEASRADPYSWSSNSGYEPPPNSATSTPVTQHSLNIRDFSEELVSHFCRQLQNFIQARLDMIDVYEKLTEASSKKCTSVDGVAFRLSMLCRQYHKYFHHPILAPIKEGMTLECESLMTLVRATIDMQHWRFLPTLFDLQEAQTKLNYWASSTFNKDISKRRFKVTKTQAAPRLYEWLCKIRELLVAKFTLYFHSSLSKSLPPASFKATSAKLCTDYYAKLSSFQRKIDATFIALIYDVSNEKDFRGLGYNFPSAEYHQPQGKNTLQPMLVIPPEGRSRLSNVQAEIYMTVATNQQKMLKDGHYQFHDSIKKLTFSVTKPDSNVVLVIVCEGQRADRDAHVRLFSIEITSQIAFLNIFSV